VHSTGGYTAWTEVNRISNNSKFIKLEKESGMVPEKEFFLKKRDDRRFKEPMVEGRVPLREFSCKLILTRSVRSPIPDGMEPVSWL
jgi:hypothetical protein